SGEAGFGASSAAVQEGVSARIRQPRNDNRFRVRVVEASMWWLDPEGRNTIKVTRRGAKSQAIDRNLGDTMDLQLAGKVALVHGAVSWWAVGVARRNRRRTTSLLCQANRNSSTTSSTLLGCSADSSTAAVPASETACKGPAPRSC